MAGRGISFNRLSSQNDYQESQMGTMPEYGSVITALSAVPLVFASFSFPVSQFSSKNAF
jgi:hypothetical protein